MATSSARVLIVESEAFFRQAIGEILHAAGFDSLECDNADTALGLALEPSIGVALVDAKLPPAREREEQEGQGASAPPALDGGLALLRHLQEARPTLRVIMLSAENDRENALDALRAGACDHLSKPLHDEELVLSVGRALQTYSAIAGRTRLRDRLGRLATAVEDLGQRVADTQGSDRKDLLSRGAAEIAADVLEASKTSLMLLNEAQTELRVVACVGGNVESLQMEPRSIGEGIAGVAFQRSEGLLVEDLQSDARFGQSPGGGRYNSESFAVVPVAAHDSPLGVLCATDRAGGDRFGDEDLALLRLLALQVAEFIDDEATTRTGSTDVAPLRAAEDDPFAASDAELVREVCDAVVEEVEPERVVRAALLPIARGLNAAPVSLYLVNPDTGALEIEGECDNGIRSDRATLPQASGLTGTVFQTGQLVAAAEPQADPRFDATVDTPEDGSAGAYLCVPLKIRGKTVGLFRAFPKDGGRVSARTGEMIAASLSAAVRSVLLYRSLLATIEEVAVARRHVH